MPGPKAKQSRSNQIRWERVPQQRNDKINNIQLLILINMESCAVISDGYGKSLLSEIKTLETFVGSGPPSDVLTPVKTLHDLARFYLGESLLDELLTDNFTNEQVWQQLKIATSRGEKFFESASACLLKKRRRMDDATEESAEKKLYTSEITDEAEDASDADSDDELKRISDRWNLDGRQSEEEDEDDDDEEEEDEENEDDEVEKEEEDADDDMLDNESPLDELKKALKSKKKKTSEVDDKFFNLEDMHSFLDQQDRLANREVSEEADEDDNDDYMFREVSSDEEETDEKNAKYSEFFDDVEEKIATKGKERDEEEDDEDEEQDIDDVEPDSDEENSKDDDDASGSDDEDDDEEEMEQEDISGVDIDQHKENTISKTQKTNDEPKSTFQKKQELMMKQITDVEESNLAEKPWHLRGEITAADRPENSLLTTHLDYKFTSAPTMDDDKDVLTIEELLRKYYDSDAFVVNVTRKVKPVGTTLKYRKDVVLDHEKSKLGLAEVLERDYLGQTQTRSQKEEEEYKENRKILDNLLLGLQMMFSNAPVTVMPPKLDLQIVENVPAIVVEEMVPVIVSDAARLTAEEVQGRRKAELIGATEKTTTNRKRERRLKKKFQHDKALQKKVRAADPNSKEAKEEAQKQLERKSKRGKHITIHETDKKKKKLTSKDFYNQLQNQVTSSINKRREGIDKRKAKKSKNEQS